VDDEVPGAVEEKTGPAAVRRVPPGLFDALPVHALISLSVPPVIPFSRSNLNAAPRSLFYWALAQMILSEVAKSPPAWFSLLQHMIDDGTGGVGSCGWGYFPRALRTTTSHCKSAFAMLTFEWHC